MYGCGDKKQRARTNAIGEFASRMFPSGVPQGLTAKIGEHHGKSLWSQGLDSSYQAAGTEQLDLERARFLACFASNFFVVILACHGRDKVYGKVEGSRVSLSQGLPTFLVAVFFELTFDLNEIFFNKL